MRKIIKNILLVSLWLLCFSVAMAADPDRALQSLLQSKAIDSDRTAVLIYDLHADFPVVAHNTRQPVTPASVMKCVTTAALATVENYASSLVTGVYLDGINEGGSFRGTIRVVGCGDPSLADGRHKDLPDFVGSIVGALKDSRINSIEGDVVVDDSLFCGPACPPSWEAADLDQSYGTGLHAFNFEGNSSGKKAVRDPAAVFKRKLTAAIREAGIDFKVSSNLPAKSKSSVLLEYSSPSMADLMRSCMFRSDNLYAESFLRLFGLRNGADGDGALSAKFALQHWDALFYPVEGVEIVDGSGLSRDNALTADFLGAVLRGRKDDPDYVAFFPLVGEEGTVKNFLSDSPLTGKMALKTGSMNGIQSYAGYKLDADFMPTHVVVVMSNGLKNRGAFRADLARFFQAIFSD